MMRLAGLILFLITAWALAERLEDTFYVPLDHPAIQYARAPDDPVARLEKRLESGEVKLEFAPNGVGYLPSLLKQLGISTDSQILVFSKTSIQTQRISPRTPRAIYFNDDVSVGFVQGGDVLELTSLDPRQGVILYTMDTEKSAHPELTRRDDCLRCHQGAPTLGVPGILVSSVHPRTSDTRDPHGNAYLTDHRSPLNERWGGWYVTGTHGAQSHLGNNTGLVDPVQPGGPRREGTQNITSLDEFFDTSRYLAPASDLVALMTLEHQTRMTNLLTRIGWDTRIAEADHKTENLNSEIEELVGYMVFADEEPLREPVAGVSTFAKTFAGRGPRDRRGRSLRDFDLKKRLFRYPLSYMIYSPAFDGLPAAARNRIYQRLYDVLAGKDRGEKFAALPAEDRQAALEIVRETKPGRPEYW
ncbi:MAG: hypothetical protein C5B51_00565 [Terriglobia bacterium]|nr:MAG: hypothetical protein C5B51_00565 [Terriglobia bacterium]